MHCASGVNASAYRAAVGTLASTLLEDKDHKVIDRYGIFDPDGRGWLHPATFVIDPKGIVCWRFVEVDYKKRASAQIWQALANIK
jgi:peroxiredoxin